MSKNGPIRGAGGELRSAFILVLNSSSLTEIPFSWYNSIRADRTLECVILEGLPDDMDLRGEEADCSILQPSLNWKVPPEAWLPDWAIYRNLDDMNVFFDIFV